MDVDSWGGYAYVGTGSSWNISVLWPQFCCEPKTILKNEVYLKRKKKLSINYTTC